MNFKWLTFLALFGVVKCEMYTENKRNARFLSFNSLDDDLKVDLDFTIPFLSIPVKKMMNTFGGSVGFPPVNINTASLVLAAILIISSTTLLPLILKKKASYYGHRFSRVLENSEFGDDTLIGVANQLLKENHDWAGCPQKLACWAGQKIYNEDSMKVWRPILRNSFVSSFVNASSIEEAIYTGRKGSTCDQYSPCKISQENLSKLWENLAVLTKSSNA